MLSADILLVLPLLIPVFSASIAVLFYKSNVAQRWTGVVGAIALCIAGILLFMEVRESGILVTYLGNWPAPFGITLVADHLAATMLVLTGILTLAVAVYSLGAVGEREEHFGYYPLTHVMVMGVCGSFLTGDLFNLFVWFEVMLIASFVLLVLGGRKIQLDGAFKYVLMNVVASTILLAGVSILYGITGSLNMADIAHRIHDIGEPGLVTVIAILFIIAFGMKAALFPLFFWLPASYHVPNIAVSAIFAGLLTKVGAYVMIRVFTLIFTEDIAWTHEIILWLSVLTMFIGVLGAVSQFEWRKILSIHIISQIGYMTLGLALYTPMALAGAVLYVAHNIIIKANLFLAAGIGHHLMGSYELKKLGGLYKYFPIFAAFNLLSAFSLAGVPPLWGFWAKFTVIFSAFQAERWIPAAFAIFVGLLTLYSMMKIWMYAFWKKHPEGDVPEHIQKKKVPLTMMIPVAALTLMTIAIGLFAEPVIEIAMTAAEELLEPERYIHAVLEAAP
ncbi:MAG: Na+/H+ antiporter subunit D [Deltaproteobacteria bacterium]|nr:MAG: Na+/H+ antiporter subunit D [Deltaproteobacteria bacterium]